ncbi:MAG: glycerophosphodiester phosphodiesterase [Oscillospiraceae bacterium]|nr:glycerophosphodiester phosphodiesterase [Oscillospiraceae bacterium]
MNKKAFIIIIISFCAVLAAISIFKGGDILDLFYGKKLRGSAVNLPAGFTVTAHAGALGTEPNTYGSIKTLLEWGADIIEADLRFNDEGTPVLAHDAVKNGQETPLLSDIFGLLKNYVTQMNIDVKESRNLAEARRLAEEAGIIDRVFFTGISEGTVPAAQKDAPGIPYYLNKELDEKKLEYYDYLQSLADKVKELGAIGLNINYKYVSKELVDTMRENGLLVSVWTADSKRAMVKALAAGADNITTRHPDVLSWLIADLEPR